MISFNSRLRSSSRLVPIPIYY